MSGGCIIFAEFALQYFGFTTRSAKGRAEGFFNGSIPMCQAEISCDVVTQFGVLTRLNAFIIQTTLAINTAVCYKIQP